MQGEFDTKNVNIMNMYYGYPTRMYENKNGIHIVLILTKLVKFPFSANMLNHISLPEIRTLGLRVE